MKSATEKQMEMMLMDKLPDFSGVYENADEIPMVEFNNHSDDRDNSNINMNPMMRSTNFYDNLHVDSPTFMNLHPSNISFFGGAHQHSSAASFSPQLHSGGCRWEFNGQVKKRNSMAVMREMIFRIAAMLPVHIDPESVKPPKRWVSLLGLQKGER